MKTNDKWLYLECNSGISGDMTIGALLDLGADQETLIRAVGSLHIEGYHLHFGRKTKCGIDAFDFDVHLEEDHHEPHNHVNEPHAHCHGGNEAAEHVHTHGAPVHQHSHVHRNIHDIFEIIDRLDSENQVKNLAKKMFTIVAEAESKAHGLPVEQVHFHEVGAIDSIIDIIGVAVCLQDLGVSEVVVSPLAEGSGYVRCQHGVMPVPVPATANIAAAHGLILKRTDNEGEMVTPTGAAIAAAVATKKELPKRYTIEKIGTGAGNKDFKNANILRAMLILPAEETAAAGCGPIDGSNRSAGSLWVLETNVDDCTGEALGFVMECLLAEGARDVYYTPAFMKKNRPAYVLHVMCREEDISAMEEVIFAQTTTIGIRRYPVDRTELERRTETVQTRYGAAEIKICSHDGRTYCYPEYKSVRSICLKYKLEFPEVYHAVKEDGAKLIRQEKAV